jgi:hypothetical protein
MPSLRACPGLAALSGLALAAWLTGCERIPGQGRCEPGYLEVDGRCLLAVGQACQGSGDCLARICTTGSDGQRFCTIPCDRDEACPAEFFCALWADRRCYPGARPPPCLADADCAPCLRCQAGRCQAAAGCQVCLQDADCGACGRCQAGECIEIAGCQACLTDATCPTCQVCVAGRCQRQAGCLLCAGDLDCPGCFRCERGGCAPIPGCGTAPCFNDLDCPSRTRCLLDRLEGLQVCLPVGLPFDAECARGGDPVCLEGVCLVGSDLVWRCSRLCLLDADCPAGKACAPDADCRFACRTISGLAPGVDCRADRDCPPDRLCGLVPDTGGSFWRTRCLTPQVCAGAAGEACAPGDERRGRCRSGLCTSLGMCSSACLGDFDCPDGTACARLEAALPATGLAASYLGCAAWGSGLGELGEPCPDGPTDCRSGACLAPAHGGHAFCTAPCVPGQAECPDGLECMPSALEPQTHLCQPQLLAGCRADADCQPGELCRLSAAGGSLACGSPGLEGGLVGARCAAGPDCQTGLCGELGLCVSVCRGPEDCPDELACDTRLVELPGGNRARVLGCGPPAGSLRPCGAAGDCQPGEGCSLWPAPWTAGAGLLGYQARCQKLGFPGGEPGEACLAAADCAAWICDLGGQCTALCREDQDCPAGFACRDLLVPAPWGGLARGVGYVRGCVPP